MVAYAAAKTVASKGEDLSPVWRRAPRVIVITALWLLVACGAGTFAFFYIMTPTRWLLNDWTAIGRWRNNLDLEYTFVNATTGVDQPLIVDYVSYFLIWQWASTVAMALGAGSLLWICCTGFFGWRSGFQKDSTTRGSISLRLGRRVRELLLSPVPFSLTVLGGPGLTVLDLLLFLVWLGLHIMWLTETTKRSISRCRSLYPNLQDANEIGVMAVDDIVTTYIPPPAAPTSGLSAPPAPPLPGPPTSKVIKFSLGTWTGLVGNLDLLLLFFPLPRCNFLHWLLGSDFPSLIKYHRWLGNATLSVYTVHGILFLGIWGEYRMLDDKVGHGWVMNFHANAYAAVISLLSGWVIWVTALPYFRRRFFNVFYVCHIVGAILFLLFGFMHQKTVMPWIMAGAVLYLLDVVLRTVQQAYNATRISAVGDPRCGTLAKIVASGGVVSLYIRCDRRLAWAGSDIVFLNVPAVSWWQWHPFTLASAPAPASACGPNAGDHKMALHIKGFNRWTQNFIDKLNSDPSTPLTLYLSGPYPSADRGWMSGFDHHFFVAGGIGATPVFGMLQEMIARRNAAAEDGDDDGSDATASKVTLVFVVRNPEELDIMPDEFLREARRDNPWLDLKVFVTGKPKERPPPPPPVESPPSVQLPSVQPPPPPPAAPLPPPPSPPPPAQPSPQPISPENTEPAAQLATEPPVPFIAALRAGFKPSSARGSAHTPSLRRSETGSEVAIEVTLSNRTSFRTSALLPTVESGAFKPRYMLAHPYTFSPGLWIATVLLAFGGAFAGLVCVVAYDGYMARTEPDRRDFTHVGMLQFAALGVGATVPPAVLMMLVHLWWSTKISSQILAGNRRSFSLRFSRTHIISNPLAPASAVGDEASTIINPLGSDRHSVTFNLPVDQAADPAPLNAAGSIQSKAPIASAGSAGDTAIVTGNDADAVAPAAAEEIEISCPEEAGPVVITLCSRNSKNSDGAKSIIRRCPTNSSYRYKGAKFTIKSVRFLDLAPFITFGRPDLKILMEQASAATAAAAARSVPPSGAAGAVTAIEAVSGVDIVATLTFKLPPAIQQDKQLKEQDRKQRPPAEEPCVAVLVGGPEGLVERVGELCREVNGAVWDRLWGRTGPAGAYLKFKPLTHVF